MQAPKRPLEKHYFTSSLLHDLDTSWDEPHFSRTVYVYYLGNHLRGTETRSLAANYTTSDPVLGLFVQPHVSLGLSALNKQIHSYPDQPCISQLPDGYVL